MQLSLIPETDARLPYAETYRHGRIEIESLTLTTGEETLSVFAFLRYSNSGGVWRDGFEAGLVWARQRIDEFHEREALLKEIERRNGWSETGEVRV